MGRGTWDAGRGLPLCVDLDGTLVHCDTMVDSAVVALRASPWNWVKAVGWLAAGRRRFKQEVAARGAPDPTTLPYREELLAHLSRERVRGRRLVLATAADERVAHAVAKHLGMFDEVIVSEPGRGKAAALVARFGARGFAYAGNERRDLHVWREAGAAIVVDAGPGLQRRVAAATPIELALPRREPLALALLRALRPHQWLKNVLLLIPPIAGHAWTGEAFAGAGLAALAWCLGSSGVYLVNDVFDLGADRAHRDKRARPFASGALSPAVGVLLAPALALAALGLAWFAAPGAALALLAYWVVSTVYSAWLKRFAWLDALALAGLFELRLAGGGAASGCPVSPWLFAFAGTLFAGLVLAKRAGEVAHQGPSPRRGYRRGHLPALIGVGAALGAAAAGVLAAYAWTPIARSLYVWPAALLAVVLALGLWLIRVWVLAARGRMHHDPWLHALRDPWSWAMLSAATAGLTIAARGWA